MNAETLKSIRNAEKESHIEVYSTAKLFESGSWLQKPVKTVLDILPLFKNHKELNALDIGSGVGRNCIPIAMQYQNIPCRIDCVDILDYAIEKLNQNSIEYGVEKQINGIVSAIDDFKILKNHYDFILSVSALEYISSIDAFINKLTEIRDGIRQNGIVCLIINSEIIEVNKENGEILVPQFEVNIKTSELIGLLQTTFKGWEVLKETVRSQRYDIPRGTCVADLSTDVVTFVAKRN